MKDPDRRPIPVVRLIIPDDGGRVLLLQRANTAYGAGEWCLPGGKIDFGATIEETIRKELQEETRLECTEIKFLFYQDSLPPTPDGMHCINLYFECSTQGNLELNSESSDSLWLTRDEISRYKIAFRNDEGLERYWRMTDRNSY
jgi:8-oxo-dGTP diphosphatase